MYRRNKQTTLIYINFYIWIIDFISYYLKQETFPLSFQAPYPFFYDIENLKK